MPNLDFSNLKNLFSGGAPSADGGWTSGTVTSPEGAFFSRANDGSIAGITPGGTDAIARGLKGASAQMPGIGRFNSAFQNVPPAGLAVLQGHAAPPPSGAFLLNPERRPPPSAAPVESDSNAPSAFWQQILRSPSQGGR
jgi:hypothetical protein